MDIQFTCDACGQLITASEEMCGHAVNCPNLACGYRLIVPSESIAQANDITFECPFCFHLLVVDKKGAGFQVACPECSEKILVPKQTEALEPILAKKPLAKVSKSITPTLPKKRDSFNYFYADEDKLPVGPYDAAQMQQFFQQGLLDKNAWVIVEGATEWQSYASLFLPVSQTEPSEGCSNRCSNCGAENGDQVRFCAVCGMAIQVPTIIPVVKHNNGLNDRCVRSDKQSPAVKRESKPTSFYGKGRPKPYAILEIHDRNISTLRAPAKWRGGLGSLVGIVIAAITGAQVKHDASGVIFVFCLFAPFNALIGAILAKIVFKPRVPTNWLAALGALVGMILEVLYCMYAYIEDRDDGKFTALVLALPAALVGAVLLKIIIAPSIRGIFNIVIACMRHICRVGLIGLFKESAYYFLALLPVLCAAFLIYCFRKWTVFLYYDILGVVVNKFTLSNTGSLVHSNGIVYMDNPLAVFRPFVEVVLSLFLAVLPLILGILLAKWLISAAIKLMNFTGISEFLTPKNRSIIRCSKSVPDASQPVSRPASTSVPAPTVSLQVGVKIVLRDGAWARITDVTDDCVHLDGWYDKNGSVSSAAGTPPIFLAKKWIEQGTWTLVSTTKANQNQDNAEEMNSMAKSVLQPPKRTLSASALAQILYFDNPDARDKAYQFLTNTEEYERRLCHYERRHRDHPAMYVDWIVLAPPRILDECGFYELTLRAGCRWWESDIVKYVVVDNDSSDID